MSGQAPKVRQLQRLKEREHPDRDDPRIQRSCLEKKKFRTKQLARDAASRATKKYEVKTSWYYCRHCRNFHLATVRVPPEQVPTPKVEVIEVEHPIAPEPLLRSLADCRVKKLVKRA